MINSRAKKSIIPDKMTCFMIDSELKILTVPCIPDQTIYNLRPTLLLIYRYIVFVKR